MRWTWDPENGGILKAELGNSSMTNCNSASLRNILRVSHCHLLFFFWSWIFSLPAEATLTNPTDTALSRATSRAGFYVTSFAPQVGVFSPPFRSRFISDLFLWSSTWPDPLFTKVPPGHFLLACPPRGGLTDIYPWSSGSLVKPASDDSWVQVPTQTLPLSSRPVLVSRQPAGIRSAFTLRLGRTLPFSVYWCLCWWNARMAGETTGSQHQ